jgi:hypothetical protein
MSANDPKRTANDTVDVRALEGTIDVKALPDKTCLPRFISDLRIISFASSAWLRRYRNHIDRGHGGRNKNIK